MPQYIVSIDQGTSSTRCIIYDETQKKICSDNEEFQSIHLHPGWTEQDPLVILESVHKCIQVALEKGNIDPKDVKGVGITNQRETTIAWDKHSGEPLSNAIVWLDVRNTHLVEELMNKAEGDRDHIRQICGLPLSTYFSATKMVWMIRNEEKVSKAIKEGRCAFGTVDSWLIYNLTGKKVYATDVTNASRTMLMDLNTCKWDPYLCQFFDIPMDSLPEIKSSAEIYGYVESGPLKGIPIAGVLGDQQAALVGQGCFNTGEAKNTYGTGCFMLFNTGNTHVESNQGLLSTVAYKFGKDSPTVYALEGSVAVAGLGLKWLRDRLGLIKDFNMIDEEAGSVENTGDVYFVPAFSGLFAPYWREDARGTIVGITQYTEARHIVRALLEAICFQTREIAESMERDSKQKLKKLKVDGGLTNSKVLLQIQSDLLNIPVVRPDDVEATAFGSAFAAGVAVGMYSISEFKHDEISGEHTYKNTITDEEREKRWKKWKMAIKRSLGWAPSAEKLVDPHHHPHPKMNLFYTIPLVAAVAVCSVVLTNKFLRS